MPFARPNATLANPGSFTGVVGGGQLWDALDEVVADDNSTYVTRASLAPPANPFDEFEVRLSSIPDPIIRSDHVLVIRSRHPLGGDVSEQITLWQGGFGAVQVSQVITQSLTQRTGAYVTAQLALDPFYTQLINNYADLSVRIGVRQLAGSPDFYRTTQVYLVTPLTVNKTDGAKLSENRVNAWTFARTKTEGIKLSENRSFQAVVKTFFFMWHGPIDKVVFYDKKTKELAFTRAKTDGITLAEQRFWNRIFKSDGIKLSELKNLSRKAPSGESAKLDEDIDISHTQNRSANSSKEAVSVQVEKHYYKSHVFSKTKTTSDGVKIADTSTQGAPGSFVYALLIRILSKSDGIVVREQRSVQKNGNLI